MDGHRYIMDTQRSAVTNPSHALSISRCTLGSGSGDGVVSEEEEQEVEENEEDQPGGNGRTPGESFSAPSSNSPHAVALQTQSSELDHWTSNTKGETELLKGAEAVLKNY